MKVSQLFTSKLVKRLFLAMMLSTVIVAFFVVIEKSVDANDGIQFTKEDAGKYVALGGNKWMVMDVVEGKPYLIMDSVYSQRAWNSSGDNSNASEIFQYLKNEFHNIITVAEDR